MGNLLSTNQATSTDPLQITVMTPKRGKVGTQVRIFGRGFGATPDQNQITFNGISAPVLAASSTSLITQVPNNAIIGSGPLTLTTPLGSVNAPDPFTVEGAITLSSPVNLIGVTQSATLDISLAPLAPAGGVVVTVESSNRDCIINCV